jgi:glutamine amidotransferase
MGNLRSVVKAIELYTNDVRVSTDPSSIEDSSAIVLPGDGAFGAAMKNLTERGWIDPIKKHISANRHFLGICLGYQLLFSDSEEFGSTKGLDIIPGSVVRFPHNELKVPHMGWNSIEFARESKFLKGIPSGEYFYFIHTFYPQPADESVVLGTSEYGVKFACIVEKGNLLAAQFHPEKSHNAGLKIIENFVRDAE